MTMFYKVIVFTSMHGQEMWNWTSDDHVLKMLNKQTFSFLYPPKHNIWQSFFKVIRGYKRQKSSWKITAISITEGYTANVPKHANEKQTKTHKSKHTRANKQKTHSLIEDRAFCASLATRHLLVQRLDLAYTELYALSTIGQKRLV